MIDQSIYGLSYVEHLSYIGVFFAVAFSGYVIPIPEEIILVLSGFLIALGFVNPVFITAACVLGTIFGDNLIYYLSGHGSRFTKKYHARVESTHAGWYMRHMRKNPMKTIFFSRFIVGMRFLNPLVSGLMKVKWRTFFIATALSSLIYIPCIIFLGYYFHDQIQILLHIMHSIREGMFALIGIGTLILLFLFIRNLVEER